LGKRRGTGRREDNKKDHVLATSRHSSSVIDVRSCRGPNCDSGHYLMKIKVRERIANVQKTPRRKTRRWDVEKLQKDTAQRDEYHIALDLKLEQKTEEGEEIDTVQKRWEHLEQAIKVVAEEIMGETKYKENEEGFDEDCARRTKLDRRCYRRRQDLIMSSIKKGEGRRTEYVKKDERKYEEATRGN
jgi:hypothetical protein